MSTLDSTLKAYSNPLSRFTVYYLYIGDSQAQIDEITEAAIKFDLEIQNHPDKITTSLRHRYLPQLEKSDLITWDSDSEMVELKTLSPEAEKLIQELASIEGWQSELTESPRN